MKHHARVQAVAQAILDDARDGIRELAEATQSLTDNGTKELSFSDENALMALNSRLVELKVCALGVLA